MNWNLTRDTEQNTALYKKSLFTLLLLDVVGHNTNGNNLQVQNNTFIKKTVEKLCIDLQIDTTFIKMETETKLV